jgi:tRNA-splicing ligase RtcB
MKPFKIYSDDIEPQALDQFYDVMEQDFVIKGALMPDAHLGYTLPIGGVVATDGVIVPAYIGFDIGCGVVAYKTDHYHSNMEDNKKAIFDQIHRDLPTGFSAHTSERHINDDLKSDIRNTCDTVGEDFSDAMKKIGTLGGGNHFCEIGYDDNNAVWIIIHSGSRHLGHSIASHYMKLASGSTKAKEGHFGFDEASKNGKSYIRDMNVALDYALQNRKMMVGIVNNAINKVLGVKPPKIVLTEDNFINRNHNHAEEKDGMWIHRKGATHAEDGMMGVIPGNMRDGSFIVRGKGNPDSLYSSSHGAGRVLGRMKAKRTLDMDEFKSTMGDIQAGVGKNSLDESPMAYKNIFDVMNNQTTLVDVVVRVRPIINIKG